MGHGNTFAFAIACSALLVGEGFAGQWALVTEPTAGDASVYSLGHASDHGHVVAGEVLVIEGGWPRTVAWLARLSAEGSVEWQKAYSLRTNGRARRVEPTADGGFVAVGKRGESYDWVFKVNASGEPVWGKTFAGETSFDAVRQAADGSYVLAGTTILGPGGVGDAALYKLDASGNVLWKKSYGGPYLDAAYDLDLSNDGGIVVAGFTGYYGAPSEDAWLLNLDADGQVLWQRTYGGTGGSAAFALRATRDGGYVVVGQSGSKLPGRPAAWVAKLDARGDVLWQRAFGSDRSAAYAVRDTLDGGFVIGGTEGQARPPQAWFVKIDGSGRLLWQRSYRRWTETPTAGYSTTVSALATSDGGYVMGGYSEITTFPWRSGWVLKLDASGSIPGCSQIEPWIADSADGTAVAGIGSGVAVPVGGAIVSEEAVPTVINVDVAPQIQCRHEASAGTAVPMLSEWARIALTAILAAAGFAHIRLRLRRG